MYKVALRLGDPDRSSDCDFRWQRLLRRTGTRQPRLLLRKNAVDEDDGYLVSFIIDENSGTSECILIDCKKFEEGPVCRIALPQQISSGTHSHWAERSVLIASQ
jgi:carotenoid cleavage dioxygenase-like enzyme